MLIVSPSKTKYAIIWSFFIWVVFVKCLFQIWTWIQPFFNVLVVKLCSSIWNSFMDFHVPLRLAINLSTLLIAAVHQFWFLNLGIYLLLVEAWIFLESKFCKRHHQDSCLVVWLPRMIQLWFLVDWNKVLFSYLLMLSAKWTVETDILTWE